MTHVRRIGVGRLAAVLTLILLATSSCASGVDVAGPDADHRNGHAAVVIRQAPTTEGIADSDMYALPADQVSTAMGLVKSVGVNTVRLLVPWAGIERAKGSYDWSTVDRMVDAAVSQGISVLATLNSTPGWAVMPGERAVAGRPASPTEFGQFAGMVAEHYRGRVSAYEIWNEPNATAFFEPAVDPAGYVDLLKASYPAIKAADPSVVVVTGGLGSLVDSGTVAMDAVKFVDKMYAAGAKRYFDALGYHPYQYTMKFSEGGYHPNSPINQMADMRAVMLANGDLNKRIWATEYGEPSSVSGEPGQADYLDDMLKSWQDIPYAGPIYVYTMRDRDSLSPHPDDTLGLYRSDGTPKPAEQILSSHVANREASGSSNPSSAPR